MWRKEIISVLKEVFHQASLIADLADATLEPEVNWGREYWNRAKFANAAISANQQPADFIGKLAEVVACLSIFMANIAGSPGTIWRQRVIMLIDDIISITSSKFLTPVHRSFGSEINWGQFDWLEARRLRKSIAENQPADDFSYGLVDFMGKWVEVMGKIVSLPEPSIVMLNVTREMLMPLDQVSYETPLCFRGDPDNFGD